MFGKDKSVEDSSSKIQSKLYKRHTTLSFQRVGKAVVKNIIGFVNTNGEDKPAENTSFDFLVW